MLAQLKDGFSKMINNKNKTLNLLNRTFLTLIKIKIVIIFRMTCFIKVEKKKPLM